jgi:hypothetical protein
VSNRRGEAGICQCPVPPVSVNGAPAQAVGAVPVGAAGAGEVEAGSGVISAVLAIAQLDQPGKAALDIRGPVVLQLRERAFRGHDHTIGPAAAQVTVTAVVSAASFHTGNRTRDRDVRSARFLNAGQYPDITFRAATLSHDHDHWLLAGELTIRQVSSPVTLTIQSVEPTGAGFRARATARIDPYAFTLTAAKGMAARYLDINLTATAEPS